ncbi:hypothetical protein ACJJTC_007443 [Scirpophaga incertulas]
MVSVDRVHYNNADAKVHSPLGRALNLRRIKYCVSTALHYVNEHSSGPGCGCCFEMISILQSSSVGGQVVVVFVVAFIPVVVVICCSSPRENFPLPLKPYQVILNSEDCIKAGICGHRLAVVLR